MATEKKTSGIFKVVHPEVKGFSYIGASTQVEIVFGDYMKWAEKGKAPKAIQEAYDKVKDKEGFSWTLLEKVADKAKLKERKQAHLKPEKKTA